MDRRAAYTEQWYHYPLPDRSVPLDDVQYVQYTHGHEDHLHEPSFHLLPKQATVLLTKQWFAGNREWLLDEGFEDVVEMTSGRWMSLGDDLSMVSLVNRSDSPSSRLAPSGRNGQKRRFRRYAESVGGRCRRADRRRRAENQHRPR